MRQRSAISILVFVMALAAGCAKKADDAALVKQIQSQIRADTQLKDVALQVTSVKGVVTLSGTVASDAARLDAYKIAVQTPGVAKVVDQMSVQSVAPSTPATQHNPPVEIASTKEPTKKEEARRGREKKAEDSNKKAQKAKEEASAAESAPAPDVAPAPQLPASTAVAPAPAPAPVTPAANVPARAPAPPPPPQPKDVVIPANTTLSVLMIDNVDSAVNHPGEIFHASLDAPIMIGNEEVVPKGADVYVRLTNAKTAGKLHGKSELTLELVKLEFQGRSYELESSDYTATGASQSKSTAKKVGAGAVIGSIIGAIAGGGKGAAIGGAVGAGAGGVYQGTLKPKEVKVPSETRIDFLLDQPVTVTVLPHAAPSD
jgi:BON domain